MINNVNEKALAAISKYIIAFIIIILVGAVTYLYFDTQRIIITKDDHIQELNEKIRRMNEKALEYEKERASRYEFLLNNLPKTYPDESKKLPK